MAASCIAARGLEEVSGIPLDNQVVWTRAVAKHPVPWVAGSFIGFRSGRSDLCHDYPELSLLSFCVINPDYASPW